MTQTVQQRCSKPLRSALSAGGRTVVVLAAAYAVARTLVWGHAWLSPYGAIAAFYRGEGFEDLRWRSSLRTLAFASESRPAPFCSQEHFSLRATARLHVPVDGTYSFATLSDDGIRVRLDGALLIDNWQPQQFRRSGRSAQRELKAGYHPLEVDFFNREGLARFRVEWCGGPIPPRTVVGPPYLLKPNRGTS